MPPPRDVQFLRDTLRNGHGCDTTRLGAANLGHDAQAGFEAHLGNLSRFAGTCLARDDDDLVGANRRDDFIFARRDRQIGRIGNLRYIDTPLLPGGDGSAHLFQQPIKNSIVLLGMQPVAEEPGRTQAEPHPIRQHGLREQLAKFVDARVVHDRAQVLVPEGETFNSQRRRKIGGINHEWTRIKIGNGSCSPSITQIVFDSIFAREFHKMASMANAAHISGHPDALGPITAGVPKRIRASRKGKSKFDTATKPGVSESAAPAVATFSFNLKPADIARHLNRFVIGQTEAKKVLSVALCDHFQHVRLTLEGNAAPFYQKQNVLLLGPTGVGKTHLIRSAAELIGVPFVKADATKFSETGYVGGDVDDLVRDLVRRAAMSKRLSMESFIWMRSIN